MVFADAIPDIGGAAVDGAAFSGPSAPGGGPSGPRTADAPL